MRHISVNNIINRTCYFMNILKSFALHFLIKLIFVEKQFATLTYIAEIILMTYIILTQNCVIRFCMQKSIAPPIYGQFSELSVVNNVNSYRIIYF